MIKENYDLIIVGSGPVGLYLANSLPKKIKILIIEGNKSFYKNKQSKIIFENKIFESATKKGSFNGLGGTSNIWGGQLNLLEKEEILFSNDENYKNTYNICRKYKYLVLSKILNIHKKKIQLLLNTHKKLAPIFLKINSYILPSVWISPFKNNFYERYKNNFSQNENISLLNHTSVIGFIKNKKNIEGIKVKRDNKVDFIKSKKIILCCGAIESARLLLSLNNVKDKVGINLGDQISIKIGYIENNLKNFYKVIKIKKDFTRLLTFKLFRKFNNQLFFIGFMFNYSSSMSNTIFYLRKFQKKSKFINLLFILISVIRDFSKNLIFILYYLFTDIFYINPKKKIEVRIGMPQLYNRKNRILLIKKKEKCISNIKINWGIEKKEKNYLKEFSDKFIKDWNLNFDFKIKKIKINLNNTNKIFQGYHPTGIFEMGEHQKQPIDRNYKVKKYNNLYVISSGLLKNGGMSNVTFLLFCFVEDFINKFKIKKHD